MTDHLRHLINEYLAFAEKCMRAFEIVIGNKKPFVAWQENLISERGHIYDDELNDIFYELDQNICILVGENFELCLEFSSIDDFIGFNLPQLVDFLQNNPQYFKLYPTYGKGYPNTIQLEADFSIAVGQKEILPIPNTNLYTLS